MLARKGIPEKIPWSELNTEDSLKFLNILLFPKALVPWCWVTYIPLIMTKCSPRVSHWGPDSAEISLLFNTGTGWQWRAIVLLYPQKSIRKIFNLFISGNVFLISWGFFLFFLVCKKSQIISISKRGLVFHFLQLRIIFLTLLVRWHWIRWIAGKNIIVIGLRSYF